MKLTPRRPIVAERGAEVPPSRPGSDAWLARKLSTWSRLALRVTSPEGGPNERNDR